jgi:hypothetical protein
MFIFYARKREQHAQDVRVLTRYLVVSGVNGHVGSPDWSVAHRVVPDGDRPIRVCCCPQVSWFVSRFVSGLAGDARVVGGGTRGGRAIWIRWDSTPGRSLTA